MICSKCNEKIDLYDVVAISFPGPEHGEPPRTYLCGHCVLTIAPYGFSDIYAKNIFASRSPLEKAMIKAVRTRR